MLASIVQTLATAFADVLELFLNAFMQALNISNLSSYTDIFPVLSTFYMYLRSFSIAMTAIVAGKALATFSMGSIDGNARDNPGMVLVKTFFAVGGIYWGGYVLDYIVHLGSIPYDQFLQVNAVGAGSAQPDFVAVLLDGLTMLVNSHAGIVAGLVELFVLALIGWNIFKLVLEVCERWLMVGILVYTSPLVYCTIPSNETSQIFKRWVSMFIGSVMQMSLSVMFLKLILSGINGGSNTLFIIKLLMILAMCKIAQRMDTYLQQLGVGVATTGGNMLDDIIAGAHALTRFGPNRGRSAAEGGSRQGILGAALSRSNLGVGLSAARRAWNNNATLAESLHAGAKAAANNVTEKSFAGRAVKGTKDLLAKSKGASNAAGAAAKASGKAAGQANGGAATPGQKAGAGAAASQQRRTGQQAAGGKPVSAAAGATRPAGATTNEKSTTGLDTKAAATGASAAKADEAKAQKTDTAPKTSNDKEGIQTDAAQAAAAAAVGGAAMAGQDIPPANADQKSEDDKQADVEAAKESAENKANMADATAGPAVAGGSADGSETASAQTDTASAEDKEAQRLEDAKDQNTAAGEPADGVSAQAGAESAAAAAGKTDGTDGAGEYHGRAVSGQSGSEGASQASEKENSAADGKPIHGHGSGDGQNTQGDEHSSEAGRVDTQPNAAATISGAQGQESSAYSGRAVSDQSDAESGVGNEAAAQEAKDAGQSKANESGAAGAAYAGDAGNGGYANSEGGSDYGANAGAGDSGARIDTLPRSATEFDPGDPTQEPRTFGDVLRKAFHDSQHYMFGGGEMTYSAADYKNAEQTAVANQDAVADRNNEFATGHEAMPQSVRENAEQIISGNTGARRPNAADAQTSFRTSGATNSSGNVLESAPEGDLRLTPQAAAAGAEIGEVKNADGSTSRVLQDRGVAGMVAGAYMASAIDQGAVTGTGERSYSALEGKSAYVQQRMESDSYYAQAGREEADEQRQTDRSTMSSFEGSIPATKSAREAADVARKSVDTLRNSGAAPEIVRKAEADYQTASDNLYQAAVASGTQRVEEARQRMADYDRQGMSHDAPEYQAAARNYKEHSDNLAKYQEAYGRASTPGYYDGLATSKANELRQDEANSHAATYDQVQKDAVSMLNNTIQNASPIALSKALLDPNYHPADCAETRAIADRLFGELLQDRKAGSQIQSVVVSDHASNATISGQELAGGRSVAVTYTKQDGSTATATFMDAVGATALPDGLREKMKVCKTGDGRDWLAEGVSSNMSARPSGTQVRRSSTVSKVFSLLRKITKS